MGDYILIYASGDESEKRFELEPNRSYRIGSKPDNDIVIDQKDVSRHHAILRIQDGSLHLTDLSSKNGSYVNGKRTSAGPLRCGDLINLSSARLVVVEVSSGAYPMLGDESGSGSSGDPEVETDDETGQFREAVTIDKMVDLLEVTSGAVRDGALVEPLSWAVEHLGFEAVAVLYRGPHDQVAMVTSAGDLGPLVENSQVLSRLVLDQNLGRRMGPRIQQVVELGERLLVARLSGSHVLVARTSGSAPALTDLRALVAAADAVIAGQSSDAGVAVRIGPSFEPAEDTSPVDRIWGCSDVIERFRRSLTEAAQETDVLQLSGEPGTGKKLAASVYHSLRSPAAPLLGLRGEGVDASRLRQIVSDADSGRGLLDRAEGGTLVVESVGGPTAAEMARLVEAVVGGRARVALVLIRSHPPGDGRAAGADEPGQRWTELSLPPLRSRREDVPVIVNRLVRTYAAKPAETVFSQEALAALSSYRWPGNVRELRGEVLRILATLWEGGEVDRDHLADHIEGADRPSGRLPDSRRLLQLELADAREEFERWMIQAVLAASGSNQTVAARRLGLSRAGLFKKMRRLKLT